MIKDPLQIKLYLGLYPGVPRYYTINKNFLNCKRKDYKLFSFIDSIKMLAINHALQIKTIIYKKKTSS